MKFSIIKKMNNKRSNRGESLAETLVAILIAGLSMTMLASMITTSVHITDESTKGFREYYQAEKEMIAHKDSRAAGTGTVTIKNGMNPETGDEAYIGKAVVSVKYYVNDTAKRTSVISYELVK